MRSLQLSLSQLQQNFKKVEFAATLECSGNRRAEMKAIPAPGGSGHTIKGLDWDAGAIGTAVWGGVKLRDVLLAAGVWARRAQSGAVRSSQDADSSCGVSIRDKPAFCCLGLAFRST